MKRFILIFSILHLVLVTLGQSDSSKPDLSLSGYVDVFYGYDFNEPDIVRQPFLYHYNRHNTVNLNIGLIRLDVENEKYHGRIALQAGTYARDNYAAEPILYRPINEAYVGFTANKNGNLWIDAGIFSSHLGFESAIGVDNPTLSRSLAAESSPYFLSGVKMTHELNDKWTYSLIFSNGWQRIMRVPGNSMPSGGTQLVFTPSKKVLVNWSTFVTTEDPDSLRRMMYFNDFYMTLTWNEKWQTIIGMDYGLKQEAKGSNAFDNWYNASFITQYKINTFWASAIRIEYFNDHKNIIINTGSGNDFETVGVSMNIDRRIHNNIFWRTEVRTFLSTLANFSISNGFSTNNTTLLTSLALKL
ncbi:MAG: porin [Flavobacteriales bacterium]|nr:porin [Flavobacteriales bacterium]